MAVEKRFLKYVSYWTTSEDDQESIPSTKRQFELAKVLEQELKELNLEKVKLDEHCYVYGLLPATAGMEGKKAVGFIAHMDTAPDFSGENVKPHPVNAPIVIKPASNKHTVFFIFFPPYYLFHIMKFYISFSLEGMILF